MRRSVLFVVLACISTTFIHAQIPPSERDALIALYNNTSGASWTNKNGWLGAVGTECMWHGVTCSGGHVQELDLNHNQLNGTIPTELEDLIGLEILYLFFNQLSGAIPPELGDLSSLRILRLNNNQLGGGIPPELRNLSSLQRLELYNNNLSEGIPSELEDLSSLTRLALQGNDLTGSVPAWLGNLSGLTSLDLNSNQLSGTIPVELGNLVNLSSLSLHSNQLNGRIPPELGDLSSLQGLFLSANKLSGSVPVELAGISGLRSLNLSTNRLTGSIPSVLGDMSSLWLLDLSFNQLSGGIPSMLGMLSNLEELNLSSNQLSGAIPPDLGSLSRLEDLDLSSNMLGGSIPTELQDLSNLPEESGVDIRWNALHSDIPSLITFLNDHHGGADWQGTQTIAPENPIFSRVGDHTVWLSWDAVSYQIDQGGYTVCSAETSSGAWTCEGWTEEKTDTTYPVSGLEPATSYDFAVVTYTDPHTNNQNVVSSGFSSLETATTATVGCVQPEIGIVWGSPITLTVSVSYDSYLWITGETTSTIDIDPLYDQWYWVTVTSAGPCEETALTWVDPTAVFANGFESGDTTEWSNSVP